MRCWSRQLFPREGGHPLQWIQLSPQHQHFPRKLLKIFHLRWRMNNNSQECKYRKIFFFVVYLKFIFSASENTVRPFPLFPAMENGKENVIEAEQGLRLIHHFPLLRIKGTHLFTPGEWEGVGPLATTA